MKVFLLLLLIGNGGGNSPSPSPQDYNWLYHQLFWAFRRCNLTDSISAVRVGYLGKDIIGIYIYTRDHTIKVKPTNPQTFLNRFNQEKHEIKDFSCIFNCVKKTYNSELTRNEVRNIAGRLDVPKSRGRLKDIFSESLKSCGVENAFVSPEDIEPIKSRLKININAFVPRGENYSFYLTESCFKKFINDRKLIGSLRRYISRFLPKGVKLNTIAFKYTQSDASRMLVSGQIVVTFTKTITSYGWENETSSKNKLPVNFKCDTLFGRCNNVTERRVGAFLLRDITLFREKISSLFSNFITPNVVYRWNWDGEGDSLWIISADSSSIEGIPEYDRLSAEKDSLKNYFSKLGVNVEVEVNGKK